MHEATDLDNFDTYRMALRSAYQCAAAHDIMRLESLIDEATRQRGRERVVPVVRRLKRLAQCMQDH